ncbi:MAG TPA: hypothetical protein VIK57_12485 [Streptosporangiaceae bacterium]
MAAACGDGDAVAVACGDVAVVAASEHALSETADTARVTAATAEPVD